MSHTVYTIGTSNRSLEEFIGLLEYYKIEVAIDVRSFPTSKFDHFKKANLEKTLYEKKIEYKYLGKELGGYRTTDYTEYMSNNEYIEGIRKVILEIKSKIGVIFCAERFPWKCHRRFIGKSLQEKDFRVNHIIDRDKVWEPE